MIIAAPSHTTSGPPSTLNACGHLGPAGQVLGQLAFVGHEPAEVHDAPHAGLLGGVGDVGGGRVVGVAEVGLADAVHQVVDDVDRSRLGECRLRRRRVVRVQRDGGDVAVQPKSASRSGLREVATTSWPSDSSSVTSRDPT